MARVIVALGIVDQSHSLGRVIVPTTVNYTLDNSFNKGIEPGHFLLSSDCGSCRGINGRHGKTSFRLLGRCTLGEACPLGSASCIGLFFHSLPLSFLTRLFQSSLPRLYRRGHFPPIVVLSANQTAAIYLSLVLDSKIKTCPHVTRNVRAVAVSRQ
jgi:hypothetical protein